MRKKASILLIDDDAAIRKTLSNILEEEGYSVEAVESGEKVIKLSNERFFNMALTTFGCRMWKGQSSLRG
ncbi:MAG: response regulator [Candidatus Bathycorpusculaceae bacterium]